MTPSGKAKLRSELARFILFGGAAVLSAIAFYIIFSRHMTAMNLTAYSDFYYKSRIGPGATFSENLAVLGRLLSFLIEFWQPYNHILDHIFLEQLPGFANTLEILVATAFLAIIAAAIVFCALRSAFIAISLLCILALIVVLNAASILPIVVPRYLFFVAPLLYLVVGIGLTEGYRYVVRAVPPKLEIKLRVVLIVSSVLALGGGSIFSVVWKREDISSLIQTIRINAPDAPVWVYHGAQPAMRLLAPKEIRQVGLVDPHSSLVPWMICGGGRTAANFDVANPRYPSTIGDALKGERKAWLLFSQAWAERSYEPYIQVAERTVGPCKLVKSLLPNTAAQSRLYFCSRADSPIDLKR